MTIDMNNLPTNPDELIEIIAGFQNKYNIVANKYIALEEEHHILSKEYNAYQNESKNKIETLTANHKLEILSRDEKIDQLLRNIFSSKSEKRIKNSFENSQQPSLFDEAEYTVNLEKEKKQKEEIKQKEEKNETTAVKEHSRKKAEKKKLPDYLKRRTVIIDIPEDQKLGVDGLPRKIIGEEVSEKLEIKPIEAVVIRYVRYKYADMSDQAGLGDGDKTIITAPMPPQILPKTIATPSLLAYIVVSKFCDAIPFYRLSGILNRFDIDISRAKMSSWLLQLYFRYVKLEQLMFEDIFASYLLGLDETPLQVLDEPGRTNKQKSFMFILFGRLAEKNIVMYKYQETRTTDWLKDKIENYKGYIQTDGYAGYNLLGKRKQKKHAGCMAHSRRKFTDAENSSAVSSGKSLASEALSYIQKLYAIEDDCRNNNCSFNEIFDIRQRDSVPILESFKIWLKDTHCKVPPKSLIGKAIAYALNEWDKLVIYTLDGCIPIDNNLVENKVRPFVMGRKNWLFSGSPDGAHASAFFYSIIETAKANGLEPYDYLNYLFEMIPFASSGDDYRALLPYNVTISDISDRKKQV